MRIDFVYLEMVYFTYIIIEGGKWIKRKKCSGNF